MNYFPGKILPDTSPEIYIGREIFTEFSITWILKSLKLFENPVSDMISPAELPTVINRIIPSLEELLPASLISHLYQQSGGILRLSHTELKYF